MCRIIGAALFVAALLGAVPSEAGAQSSRVRLPELGENRRYLDYYVSRYRLGWNSGGSDEADAVGGRLMWSLAPLVPSIPSPWLDRTLVGGYVTHAPEEANRDEMLRYGAQMDIIVTPEPLAGRVEPLVSLAAGAVRVTESGMHWTSVPYVMIDEPGEQRSSRPTPLLQVSVPHRTWTAASVTPGIGARIRLMRGVSLRTDARQVIDFYNGKTSNLELSGGISVGT